MYKPGDTIKLKGGEWKTIKAAIEDQRTAQVGARFAASVLRKTGEEMRNTVHELFPETKAFNCTIDYDNKEIVIGRTLLNDQN